MSRTIRRKNYSPKWVTHDLVAVPTGYLAWGKVWNPETKSTETFVSKYEAKLYIQVPLEGKALAKSLSKHHGDHGYVTHSCSGRGAPKWFRQNEEQSFRAKNRQELHKYLRDDEYECMISSKSKLPYWD